MRVCVLISIGVLCADPFIDEFHEFVILMCSKSIKLFCRDEPQAQRSFDDINLDA